MEITQVKTVDWKFLSFLERVMLLIGNYRTGQLTHRMHLTLQRVQQAAGLDRKDKYDEGRQLYQGRRQSFKRPNGREA